MSICITLDPISEIPQLCFLQSTNEFLVTTPKVSDSDAQINNKTAIPRMFSPSFQVLLPTIVVSLTQGKSYKIFFLKHYFVDNVVRTSMFLCEYYFHVKMTSKILKCLLSAFFLFFISYNAFSQQK